MVEADPQVVELIREIDGIVLPGPRKRVTEDVTAWGRREDRNLPTERLLKAYNEAVEDSVEEARRLLRRSASEEASRPVLFSLLNDPRATDLHRQIALDALADSLDGPDLAEFGRVNAKQRPGVVPRVRQILTEVELPEARFLLLRLIPAVEDEPGPTPRDRPLETPKLPETEDDRADLLFESLALSAPAMAALRQGEDGLRQALSVAADARDKQLIAAGRSASGLSDYESVLRRELHLLIVLAGLAVSEETASRARDSLFGLDLTRLEQEAAPNLPSEETVRYVSRALSPENRRNRPDRAVAALRLVERIAPPSREEVREEILAALSAKEDEVRFAAAAALAGSFEPTGKERSALVESAAGLPDKLREQLQPLLGAIGSEVRSMSFRQVIDWAEGAPTEEADRRVQLLLEEWKARAADVENEDAEAAIAAVGRKLPLPPGPIRQQLVDATAAWLRQRRGTAVANRALIDGWRRFPEFAVREFPAYGRVLNARAARRLLFEALHPGGVPRADSLAIAAAAEPEGDRDETVLMPVLRETLARTPDLLTEAIGVADDQALVNLLAAAIAVIGEQGRALDDLEASGSAETTEALRRARARVIEALEVAERDSVKNEDLRTQLALVRDALRFDSVAGPADAGEAVAKWRAGVVERYGSVALEPGPAGGLNVSGARSEELVDLMLELDPRVNGRGVVPANDRPHFAKDLARVVAAFAALNEPAPATLSRRASPRLREELERATLSAPEVAAARLVESLADSDEVQGARALAMVARVADADAARDALGHLPGSGLRAAAPIVSRALSGEHAKVARARLAQQSRETRAAGEIARRLAVPFQAIETRLFSYFRLRGVLEEVGWRRVTEHLGAELPREKIDPVRFTVIEEARPREGEDSEFLVRSLGIEIAGQVVDPAIVEPIAPTHGETTSEEESGE